jgi:SSS family solute:Na+ symporter
MGLSTIDWLIMLVYFAFVLGIGFALKRSMRTSKDFFQAGRSIPAWVCGLAFLSANLGAQEALLLDRRNSCHGFRGNFHDAFLLRVTRTIGAGVPANALR